MSVVFKQKTADYKLKRGMMRNGQITVFVILGLVLLLSAAIVIYIYQARVTAPFKQVIAVPEDVQPVYDYVTECIGQIGREGLALLGLQGGYINVPPIIERNPNSFIAADGVGFFKTPLWYYEGEDRTPPLEFMQRELLVHVKQNLEDCVDNFDAFREQLTVRPVANVTPVVTFTDEDVIINVKWPIEIVTKDRRTELDEFIVSYPVRLKRMWELGDRTMKAENRGAWFENLTMDLLSSNKDIPLSGMEVFCGTKKWHLRSVRQELQNLLYYNLPRVRVDNTKYPEPLESLRTYNRLKDQATDIRETLAAGKEPDWPRTSPADVFEMNRMRFDVGSPRTDLKAAFVYLPDWPLLLNVQPNDGGVLSTSQMKGASKYLRFLCLNQWHFTYDLIYPVKMVVRDDSAFNGEGFLFQFAFPVIIEDNEESREFFGLRRFVVPSMGADFCENFGSQSVDVRALGFTETSPVAQELEDAEVRYKCLNRECVLGRTFSDGSGAIHLSAFLPEGCGNPIISAHKEGYLESQKYAGEERVDLLLTKLKKLPYTMMIHPYYEEVGKDDPMTARNSDWLEEQSYSRFTKTMRATVSISLRNGTFDQYLVYPAENGTDEVEFVYGTAQYDVDILLFKGDTPVGGYHAKNLTITYDEVAANNNVVFHVFEYRPLPEAPHQQAGMFLFLYERGKYSDGTPYGEALRPAFTP